jgi:hypothetical protein
MFNGCDLISRMFLFSFWLVWRSRFCRKENREEETGGGEGEKEKKEKKEKLTFDQTRLFSSLPFLCSLFIKKAKSKRTFKQKHRTQSEERIRVSELHPAVTLLLLFLLCVV